SVFAITKTSFGHLLAIYREHQCFRQLCVRDARRDSKSSDRKIVWVRSPPPAFSLHAGLRGKIECYRDKSRIASSRTKTQRLTFYSSTNRQQLVVRNTFVFL